MQAAENSAAVFKGVGVHGGQPATATIRPAAAGSGVSFRRVDLEGSPTVPARFDFVVDTRLCTVLSNSEGVTVSTVEHVMAALAGLHIGDAVIDLDGPEMPIMDGSSAAFIDGIVGAGLHNFSAALREIEILETVRVEKDGKVAELSPGRSFQVSFEIDFEDAAIGRQSRSLTLVNGTFVRELSRARTFGRLHEAQQLRAMGLAKGASLENAIVVDGDKILNEDGLRFDDEFVRHKMLDAVGDLALAGAPIRGKYRGVKAGHEMTNLLLRALFERPTAWRWREPEDQQRKRAAPAYGMAAA